MIKNLEKIWGLKQDWDQKYERDIKNIPFKDINWEDLEELAEDYIFQLNNLSK